MAINIMYAAVKLVSGGLYQAAWAGAVSVMSLQTAMLTQFGGDRSFQRLMNSLTGLGVFLIVFFIAVYMVLRANEELR